jgi:hypothetical protein
MPRRNRKYAYGDRPLGRGCAGADVVELQVRLAGFRGTVPDGEFGPGTERQVMTFQRDFMRMKKPTGIVDRRTMQAMDRFARTFPIDFARLRCPCGRCGGFGSGRFRGEYVAGKPATEPFHRYEYPGMHRMLLWAVRAARFYAGPGGFAITSGYRCAFDNDDHGRSTTNHHGKAIDIVFAPRGRARARNAKAHCDAMRGLIVETADAQVGWHARNRKALEPADIAPTWVHYDVRCYEPKYLRDEFFCTTLRQLDDPRPIRFDVPKRRPAAGRKRAGPA